MTDSEALKQAFECPKCKCDAFRIERTQGGTRRECARTGCHFCWAPENDETHLTPR